MRKLFLSILITGLTLSNYAFSHGMTKGQALGMMALGTAATTTPLGTYYSCIKEYRDGGDCLAALASNTAAMASTILLLKEVEAAQPDALDYIAGAAPSPALYSAVEKLQKFASDEKGIEMTFEEAVNDIISNI